MKRIQYACLAQTIHFTLKDDIDHGEALELVKQEVAAYKASLDRRHTKYKLEGEEQLPDGSVLLKLSKQYNSYPCGPYLD